MEEENSQEVNPPNLTNKTFSVSSRSPMVGAETVFSQRKFWKTITQLSRMLSMRAGMWLSPGKGGPSKPPGPERTRERSTSSRGCTRAPLPSPTRTKANTLSSSDFRPHVERSATGNHVPLPNTQKQQRTDDRTVTHGRNRCSFIFVYF